MKIAAIIIDDDIDSREILCSFLKSNSPEIAIAGQAATVKEALALVGKVNPDLLFLDIELPDGSAFDLLEHLPEKDFEVIFITAFDQYAVQAFKMAAIDYLLKPVSFVELADAVSRMQQRLAEKQFHAHWSAFLHNSAQKKHTSKKLAIATAAGFVFVEIDIIIRLEAHTNYTHFYIKGKNKIISSRTLGHYEEVLPEDSFHRIHHSHLVNIDYIDKYNKAGAGGTVVMTDGTELTVSQRKKEEFLKRINP